MRRRLSLGAYSLVSEVATPLAAAHAYYRGGIQAAKHALALEREPPRTRDDGYLLWVHGASIGETTSALPLVRALLAADSDAAVVMTASTPNAIARLAMEQLGPRVHLRHRPHDGALTMRRFLDHWRPDGLVIVESELWPNLLLQTQREGVPIALVNARLSAQSLERWAAYAPATLRLLLCCCSVALAQSPQMAEKLRRVLTESSYTADDESSTDGGSADAPPVAYCGDLKQLRGSAANAGPSAGPSALAVDLRARLGERLRAGRVWLAASTHEGEEAVVLAAHAALRRGGYPDLLLVLVPRHPERGAQVAAVASSSSGTEANGSSATAAVARRSVGEAVLPETSVYVCDTLGELPVLYGLTGIAFVGGSLVPLGGHSLLEAAQAADGCAVLHGPHTEAVEHAADALASTSPPAARCVRDADELQTELEPLLSDARLRDACRAAASDTARALEKGVLDRVWLELERPLGLPQLHRETCT